MTDTETATDRTVWTLTGKDALGFLQGLLSNDLRGLETGPGIVWAAFLSPQGKYLADFFVVRLPEGPLLIDIATRLAADTLRRLNLYRLRTDVQIAPAPLHVLRGTGLSPAGAMPDPRHPALGWRSWSAAPGGPPMIDWDRIRVEHMIPESGIELLPDESYILEQGFERLNGVDFRKGCYVGQEVTARMKHKTELRKGLARIALPPDVASGTEICVGERVVGTVLTRSGEQALAYLRLDLSTDQLTAAGHKVRVLPE